MFVKSLAIINNFKNSRNAEPFSVAFASEVTAASPVLGHHLLQRERIKRVKTKFYHCLFR